MTRIKMPRPTRILLSNLKSMQLTLYEFNVTFIGWEKATIMTINVNM